MLCRRVFGWEMGPFALYEAMEGMQPMVDVLKEATQKAKQEVPAWVLAQGDRPFYRYKAGEQEVYLPTQQGYGRHPEADETVVLGARPLVWQNEAVRLLDIGQGVLLMTFDSKMRVLNGQVMAGLQEALRRAEADFVGLVIGHQTAPFSVGADLSLLFAYIIEEEWEEVDAMVRHFQQVILSVRTARCPVVVATQGMVLGGGCELLLHADRVQAGVESYIGLVEAGVGLLPAGGGTKEMARRLGLSSKDLGGNNLRVLETFKVLATAQVSSSAFEAEELGFLTAADQITRASHQVLFAARQEVLRLAPGYAPLVEEPIFVMGAAGRSLLTAGIIDMQYGGYASAHDAKVAAKLAHVLCGGDLSSPGFVSTSYLLDLEREAFLSLCAEPKTIARIQGLLTQGRPIRN